MEGRVPITFDPAGCAVWVEPGTTVLDAARLAGLVLPAPCGGRGVCGACGVRILIGELGAPSNEERQGLKRAPAGVRLACRARIEGPVTVRPVVAAGTRVSGVARAQGCPPAVAGVDLGTTSVAAVLIDPRSGIELARASVPNAQQSFGADVLSRLSAALEGHGSELRHLAEQSVVAALKAAADATGCSHESIERLVIAGNSAMTALVCGLDVSSLAVHPFIAPPGPYELAADSVLLSELAANAEVMILPGISGFVGGDAVAAILSAGVIDAAGPMMLVDFGTNAEIVLVSKRGVFVASAAAGPAFEGGGISCGGPAADGAATEIGIASDGAVRIKALGDAEPRWFSGSGLVSAVAALLRCGHIERDGRLVARGPLGERFESSDDGVVRVRLGDSDDACLAIDQLDIRALQLAKAAVRVGIEAVLHAAKLRAKKLDRLLIAGAFGSAMATSDLVELGVIPSEVQERTERVGNAALDGAAAVALSPSLLELARTLTSDAVHVDLASDPGFAKALVDATEFGRFTG